MQEYKKVSSEHIYRKIIRGHNLMDRNLLIGAIFVIILIVVAVFISQSEDGAQKTQAATTYYVINYKNETNVSGIGVAQLLSNGSYQLDDGTVVPATDVTKIEEKYNVSGDDCCENRCPLTYRPVCGVDGRTYINFCAAALANVQVAYSGVCNGSGICDDPCIEPKPELRFVCESGQIVKNRIDCAGNESCSYVVGKYFVCPDGKKVKDPSECDPTGSAAAMPSISTVYVCSDGREVASESDCSADCYPTTVAAAPVSANYGSGGVKALIYECWDGLYVKKPTDCARYCNRSCICTYEYNPVCVDGRTYANPCLARCDGHKNYSKGECPPDCAKIGESCTPPTLTHVSSSCCEAGSYCSANGVCVPIEQCKKVDESCTRPNVTYTVSYVPSLQGDCCEGLICDENYICSNRSSCGTSGTMCGWSSTVAAAPTYYGACCEGYRCSNNTCILEQCVSEFGDCQIDADCCSGLECSKFDQCRKPCIEAGAPCKSSSECCSGLSCINNTCAKKTTTPSVDLCSGPTSPQWGDGSSCATGYYEGVWGTYCAFCYGGKLENQYYCVVNYSYDPTGLPVSTLTDQVTLANISCRYGCSGGACK
jgi:hypothetical protein